MDGALGGQPVEEGQGDLLAHHPVVAAGRAQRRAVLGGERNPTQLARGTRSTRRRWSGATALAQTLPQQRARPGGLVAGADAGVAAERIAQEHVGRAGVERIAVPSQHAQVRVPRLQPPEQLVAQPRLADAGRPGDHRRPGRRLLHHARPSGSPAGPAPPRVPRRAWACPAAGGSRRGRGSPPAAAVSPPGGGHEAGVQQAGGQGVEADASRALARSVVDQAGGAIHGVADAGAAVAGRRPGGDGELRAPGHSSRRASAQRAAMRA